MSVTESQKTWNVGELLTWSTRYLSEKEIDSPRLNVEWLLSHTLRCKRIDLYTNYDRPLNQAELTEFKSMLLRRIAHEPLQYIVGTAEFMGLTFEVNTDVLIPRPDTELLVEKTIELCLNNIGATVRILEIGTGSGNISISIAFYLEKKGIPHTITALDISEKALILARRNSERVSGSENINFVFGNIFDETTMAFPLHSFDVIVSNPPYVSDEEFMLLPKEVKDHEPVIALKADENGFAFYNYITKNAKSFFSSNLTKKHVIFEVGYNQAEKVKQCLAEHGFEVKIFKDLGHINRVVCGSLNEQN